MIELHDLWGNLEAKSRFDLGLVIPPGNTETYFDEFSMKRSDKPQKLHCKSGLKSLSRSILGIDLPKDIVSFQSDWRHVPLSENQIIYSARDAWAGAAIANRLAHFDPEIFGREALIELCQCTETPIPLLAERRRRRKDAKEDLQRLLLPYSGATADHRLPKPVQIKAKSLRQVINKKIFEESFVFEMYQ